MPSTRPCTIIRRVPPSIWPSIGLRRAGFNAVQIRALQTAFSCLFRRVRNLTQAIAEVEAGPCSPEVRYLIDFIRASKRGVCFGPRGGVTGDSDQ